MPLLHSTPVSLMDPCVQVLGQYQLQIDLAYLVCAGAHFWERDHLWTPSPNLDSWLPVEWQASSSDHSSARQCQLQCQLWHRLLQCQLHWSCGPDPPDLCHPWHTLWYQGCRPELLSCHRLKCDLHSPTHCQYCTTRTVHALHPFRYLFLCSFSWLHLLFKRMKMLHLRVSW